jgi:hypothetical protein
MTVEIIAALSFFAYSFIAGITYRIYQNVLEWDNDRDRDLPPIFVPAMLWPMFLPASLGILAYNNYRKGKKHD